MVGEKQTGIVVSFLSCWRWSRRSCPRGCQSPESKSSEQIGGVSVTSKQPQRMSIISLTEEPLFLSSSLSFVATCTHRLHLYRTLWERGFPVLFASPSTGLFLSLLPVCMYVIFLFFYDWGYAIIFVRCCFVVFIIIICRQSSWSQEIGLLNCVNMCLVQMYNKVSCHFLK